MGEFFLSVGSFALLIGIVWVIVAFARKTPKKKPMLLFVAGFVFMIIGGALADPGEESEVVEEAAPVEDATEEATEPEEEPEEADEEEAVEVADESTQGRLTAMLETNTPFNEFADEFFTLSQDEQAAFFDETMESANVSNWGGVVLQAQANNVMIYGGDPALYNGEDWITLMSERPELIHYVINASVPSKAQVAEVKEGDTVIVNGGITRAGNAEEPVVWTLENALIVDVN